MGVNSFGVRDANMKATLALPNGAATTTQAAGLDTGNSSRGDFSAQCELQLSAPAMLTAEMPDAKTMKYDILTSDNADLSAPTVLVAAAITQTGAGGAGCAAQTYKFRLPTNVKRYVGHRAIGSAAGNSSAKSSVLEVLF